MAAAHASSWIGAPPQLALAQEVFLSARGAPFGGEGGLGGMPAARSSENPQPPHALAVLRALELAITEEPASKAFSWIPDIDINSDSEWMWLIGVVMTLIGTTLTATGLLLQKHSHNVDQGYTPPAVTTPLALSSPTRSISPQSSTPKRKKKSEHVYFTRWRWIVGMAVYVLGHVICWLGLGFAPMTVTTCLQCWSMLVVFTLAPLFLGEELTWQVLGSVPLLIGGCVLVVLYGPRGYSQQTVETLTKLFADKVFLAAFGASAMFLVLMAVRAWSRRHDSSRAALLSSIEYVFVAAVIAWFSVQLSKCTSALLITTVHHGENQLWHWEFWVLLVGMVTLALTNVHFLNLALRYGDAVVVVPVYEALSMAGQIVLGGVIFFNELADTPLAQQVPFWVGVVLVLVGVVFVARDRKDDDVEKEEDDEDDGEEVVTLLPPPTKAQASAATTTA